MSLTTDSSGSHPPATAAATVATVSIKLPPFWSADPEVWFAQVEAQFSTRRVTSQKTRFDYVVSSLGPEFATEIRDLLLRPPADNPYNTLKTELIKRTAASEQRKLQQLISGEELGDRKPTQLLRRMQQLLGERAADPVAEALFLQRLPSNVRMVLASTADTMDLNTLADMADKVVEVAHPSVAAISGPPQHNPSEYEHLKAEVDRLTKRVASLTAEQRRRQRGRSRDRQPRSPAPQDTQQHDATSLCWYHSKFGGQARRCQPPCNWGNDQASH